MNPADDRKYIAKLDLDVQDYITKQDQVQKTIETLTKKRDELGYSGKREREELKKIQAELDKSHEEYNKLAETITANIAANRGAIDNQYKMEQALKASAKTYREYNALNDELAEIKMALNPLNASYLQDLYALNAKIAENNTALAEQAELQKSGYLSMDFYKTKITEAFDSINVFNGGISGFISRAQAAGGAGKLFSTSVSAMKEGIVGMGKAIATNPLGLLLSVLSPIIQKMGDFTPITQAVEKAMAALAPVMDLVNKPMQLLGAAVEWVAGGISALMNKMFDSADAASKLTAAQEKLNAQMVLQDRNNDTAKQKAEAQLKIANDQTKSIAERNAALIKAATIEINNMKDRQKLAEQGVALAETELAHKKGISEKEVQILWEGSEEQRLAFIEKNNITKEELQVLEKAYQEKERLASEEASLMDKLHARENARRKEAEDNARKAAEDARKAAEETKKAVEAAIQVKKDKLAVFVAENAAHKNSLDQQINYEKAFAQKSMAILKDELAAKKLSREQYQAQVIQLQTQLRDNVEKIRKGQLQQNVESLKQELDVLLQNHDAKKSTLQQELDFQKMISQKKQEIINAEYEASDKTSADAHARNMARAEETKNLAAQNAEVALNNANAQLNVAEQLFERRKQGETEVTAQSIALDKAYYDQRYQLKMQELQQGNAFNAQELQQKYDSGQMLTTAESDYLTNVLALQNEYSGQKKSLHDQENALQIEGIRKNYEEQRANATGEFDLQRLAEDERHEVAMTVLKQQLEDKKITQDEYNAKEQDEIKTNADNKKKIDTAVFNNKLDLASQTFTNLQALVGKESAAGKAMAVAQATIDTYKAAVSAYAAMSAIPIVGPALGAVAAAAAVAAGIANVKKITSTKTPKAEKGALFSIGGKRHSQGGTLFTGEDGTRFEAEKGEIIGVMNRNAARHFMAFNNTFPAGGSGSTGGNYFAQGGIVSREVAQQGINLDELAAKIAQANAAIPAPVVAVQDIITQSNSYVKVRQAANF